MSRSAGAVVFYGLSPRPPRHVADYEHWVPWGAVLTEDGERDALEDLDFDLNTAGEEAIARAAGWTHVPYVPEDEDAELHAQWTRNESRKSNILRDEAVEFLLVGCEVEPGRLVLAIKDSVQRTEDGTCAALVLKPEKWWRDVLVEWADRIGLSTKPTERSEPGWFFYAEYS